MTLPLKINLIVGALTVLFIGSIAGLQLRSMRDSVHEEVVAANIVASQLLQRTAWAYAAQGTPAMLGYLQSLGRIRSNEVTLFDGSGKELYVSPPSAYKPGRDAPDWFASLVSPPPSQRSIEFPDGRLVVRANASRAVLDAWDDLAWLAGSSLALAVAINALVFWLVGRATRPFARIVDALETVQHGDLEVALPPLPGTEAAAIGGAFNAMVGRLRDHIETEKRAVRAETELSHSRELSRWIDQHLEQERRLIARELHDELGQSVTAMRSMALSIAQRCGDSQEGRAAQLIAEESSRLYDAMHGIIPRLTPLVLDSFGLTEALAELAERTRRAHPGVTIDMQVELDGARLDREATLAVYRAAQEGITNALRHGEARRIGLTVLAGEGVVTLRLRDDGRGLPAAGIERKGHFGLRWLIERIEGLGGSLQVEPAEPRGVELTATLPQSRIEAAT